MTQLYDEQIPPVIMDGVVLTDVYEHDKHEYYVAINEYKHEFYIIENLDTSAVFDKATPVDIVRTYEYNTSNMSNVYNEACMRARALAWNDKLGNNPCYRGDYC